MNVKRDQGKQISTKYCCSFSFREITMKRMITTNATRHVHVEQEHRSFN
jgi:hypothetical protein